jgi:hypothetical protein
MVRWEASKLYTTSLFGGWGGNGVWYEYVGLY